MTRIKLPRRARNDAGPMQYLIRLDFLTANALFLVVTTSEYDTVMSTNLRRL